MAWTGAQVVAWLDLIEPQAEHRSHFEWLEMVPSASSQAIQNAYHAVARTRHPDLLRTTLTARDHDRLVRMYARIANAYAALRPPEAAARYLRERRDSSQRAAVAPPPHAARTTPLTGTPIVGVAAPTGVAALVPTPAQPGAHPPPASPPPSSSIETDPIAAMNPRALAHYRRAEGALKAGDRAAALLQIRMAIAADPRSQLLRAALAELQQQP